MQARLLKQNVSFSLPVIIIFILIAIGIGSYLVYKSFASGPIPVTATSDSVNRFVPGQVLLRFKPGVAQAKQDELLARYSGKVIRTLSPAEIKVVKVPDKALDAVIAALLHNPTIDFAEKDQLLNPSSITPNDPYYTGAETPYNNQWPFVKTQTNDAWDKTTGTPSAVVAVLDTGIDPNHPDIGTMVSPWSVVRDSTNVTYVNTHGIYTSGVVNARTNNATGVASTCWGCSVMPVQVSTSGDGRAASSDLYDGMKYAADPGAKIINISYAGTSSQTMRDGETYAFARGLLIFAAAGNSECDCKTYPASDPGVIGVTSVGGSTADFIEHNYGTWVQIAAPTGVATTTPGGGYSPVGGTSISSPFAAGVAGLLWSAQPAATADQVKQAILTTADQFTDRFHPERTTVYGRINAYKAMTALTGSFSVTPPDTLPPTIAFTSPTNSSSTPVLSGQTVVTASATDNVAVARVELRIDNVLYASDNQAPYEFYVDTTKYSDGFHSFTLRSYDTSLKSTSVSLNVRISNGAIVADTTPPSISLTSPGNGTTVSGTVPIASSASDNVGVTSSELYIDGVLRNSSTTGSTSFNWDTTKETNGNHTISAKAYDAANNVGTSTTVTVTVSNQGDSVAPTVFITAPSNGTVLSTTSLIITANASDNVAVTSLKLFIDGSLKTTVAANTLSYKWNINKRVSSGQHTIMVQAFDVAGNVGQTSVMVVK